MFLGVEFDPLDMSTAIRPCLMFIENDEELTIYLTDTRRCNYNKVCMYVGMHVSQKHKDFSYTYLCSLVTFADRLRIEAVIVNAEKNVIGRFASGT